MKKSLNTPLEETWGKLRGFFLTCVIWFNLYSENWTEPQMCYYDKKLNANLFVQTLFITMSLFFHLFSKQRREKCLI